MKSNHITRQGWQKLDDEFKYLWKIKRPEITRIVSFAAAQGDRSENGDYIYNKRLLREIDQRIRFLDKRLDILKIVDYSPQQEGKVFFGASVEIEDEAGEISNFRIVGTDETDIDKHFISINSPMAMALIGKQVDDEVKVKLPKGSKTVFINKIDYRCQ
ncbi:MAG: transcription elongation factor GreB [Pseudomonadota bacterium]